MCALIAMAVHDTEENKRSDMTRQTLDSLLQTVDFTKHRLVISDNGSCEDTQNLYQQFANDFKDVYGHHKYAGLTANFPVLISNGTNLGTAMAINHALHRRDLGEHCIKIDNDVIIHHTGWVDMMEEAISKDPRIGIIGLKRKDLIQYPGHPDPNFNSELLLLPHNPYDKWLIVERTNDIMGTCTMFNSALLDKVGYSWQPGLYGFEDNLFCHRSHLAGFYNCFLHGVEIDHIDPGGTDYQRWKEKHSGEQWNAYNRVVKEMIEGKRSIYYNPFENTTA